MTILLHDMNVSNIVDSRIFEQEGLDDFLFSSTKYEKIAFRMIDKYSSCEARLRMMRDEDAIYFITHKLIIASCKWYGGSRQYTHRGYLSRHGKWAVQTWSTQKEKRVGTDWNNIPLGIIEHNQHGDFNVEDFISYNKDVSRKQRDSACSYLDGLIERAHLSARQMKFIRMKYWRNMNNAQIASRVGVTREYIRQIIALALNRLREVELGKLQ